MGRGDRLQQWGHRRGMLANGIDKRARAPQKDPRVPRVVARRDKFLGTCQIGLLSKPLHSTHRHIATGHAGGIHGVAQFDVAISCLRPRRRRTQNHDPLTASGQLHTCANHLNEAGIVADHMVGWEDAYHRLRRRRLQQKRRQSACWGRIARFRFGKNVAARYARHLLCDHRTQKLVGDDPHILRCGQGEQPIQCLLDHGLLAIQRQHLLGVRPPAARPEARPTAARQNHRSKSRPGQPIRSFHRPLF